MAPGFGDGVFRRRARDRLTGEKLASQGLPKDVKGKPLKIPQVNFTVSLESKVRSMFGPPHFATRARRIENLTRKLMDDLAAEYAGMIERFREDPDTFDREWNRLVRSVELDKLNDLIEKHNKYYPIEANLQIDPESGAPLLGSVPWKPKDKISTELLLERFPPDMTGPCDQIGE